MGEERRWGSEKERKQLSSLFPEIFSLPKRKKKRRGEGKGFGGEEEEKR